MTEINNILALIIILLSSASLAIQIAYESSLAFRIKSFVFNYYRSFETTSKFQFWKKFIGTASYILLPLLLIYMALVKIYLLVKELLDCPLCTSYHITWLLLYFYLNYNLIDSLLIAPVTLIFVKIILLLGYEK